MANLKKVSALVLLLCGFVCLCLLSGCDNPQPTEPTTTPTTEVPDAIYTISVKTAGGLMLSDEVDYCIFDSAERNYIVKHGPMPKDGIIIFTAPRSDDYIFILKMVFPIVMYGCESRAIKEAEHHRIDAFKLWC